MAIIYIVVGSFVAYFVSIFWWKNIFSRDFFYFSSKQDQSHLFFTSWSLAVAWFQDTLPLDFRNFPELHGDISAIQKEAKIVMIFGAGRIPMGKKRGQNLPRLCCQVLKYKKIRWCLGFVGFPDIFARAVALKNCITFISFCGLQPLVVRKAAEVLFSDFDLMDSNLYSWTRCHPRSEFCDTYLSLLSQPKPLFGNKTCSHPLGGVNHSWWQNTSLFPNQTFRPPSSSSAAFGISDFYGPMVVYLPSQKCWTLFYKIALVSAAGGGESNVRSSGNVGSHGCHGCK